jgi:hypothetical protein
MLWLTRMLQVFVPNILSMFSDVCCKCVYLDVAYVSYICFKCFIYLWNMLQVLHLDVSKAD